MSDQPKPFAKLFEFKDIGQVLVELTEDINGDPIVRMRANDLDGKIVEFRQKYQADKGGRLWARVTFDSITSGLAHADAISMIDEAKTFFGYSGPAA